jgi:hypothetical protein
MDGNAPWGGQAPSPPPTGSPTPMPNASAAPPPPWPRQPVAKQPRRGFLLPIGVALAVLLSAAALVVSLMKGSGQTSSAPTATQSAKPEPTQVFVDVADREVCQAMGPLMRESSDARKAFTNSGAPNTPERKAAIPQFVTDSYDWGRRAQDILNQHSDPPRFLTRNFQRYIDHTLMYAEGLSPDRDSSIFENQLYDFGVIDLSGLIGRCSEVDAPWWK